MKDWEEVAKNYKPIVFAYWVEGKLVGFRADTFGTISNYPKIYGNSREQIDTVLTSTKGLLNSVGTHFMKAIANRNVKTVNLNEESLNNSVLIKHVSKTEEIIRGWKEFELAVHPFIGGFLERLEKWQMDNEIANLRPPIEVHKFKVLENEN